MSTATFVATDTTTQGNWYCSGGVGAGTYGQLGYYKLVGSGLTIEQSIPSGLSSVTNPGTNTFSWAANTAAARGLQRADGSTRDEDTWFSGTSFYFLIQTSDTTTRRLRLYSECGDNVSRSQTLEILEYPSTTVLDSRNVSSFVNGSWYSWDVTGSVYLRLTLISGGNCVASGIFWDTPGGGTPAFLAAGPRLIQQAVKRASYF